jgi:hypothetical protein
VKADPFVQARLLELQELDTRLQQITHARTRLPQFAALDEAVEKLQAAADDTVRAETSLSDVRRELARAEADVQQVRDRASRDQARLDSGAGMTSRDLTALQSELESLARRQADLEEIEIEAMERQEAAEARVASSLAEQDRWQAEVDRLEAERDSALAELAAEHDEVAAPRAALVAGIDDALITLYDKIRASSGGLAAAELKHGRCGGCRLELNQVELRAIDKAAVDEVVRCEECGRILVRIPDPQS